MEEKDAGERNSAYAQKTKSLHGACFRYIARRPNALRATFKSGFLTARYIAQIVPFAPVEYLTYEIRNISDLIMRLVWVDAHIDPYPLAGVFYPFHRRVFRLPRRSVQIRTVIAFC